MAAVIALLGASVTVAIPAQADDYPSWADVEAARASTAATEAEVTRIGTLLTGLETQAATLGDAAITASAASATADTESRAAAAHAEDLARQLATATEKAQTADVQLGLLGAQLYRSGASDAVATLLLVPGQASDLLSALSTSTRLSELTSGIRDRALAQRNLVQSLEEQAAVASTERDRLAVEAKDRAAAAAEAQRAADAQLAEQRTRSDVLDAQLASLKNTTAETERSYRAGVAAAAAYQKQQEEAARAAAASAAAQAAAAAVAAQPAAASGSGGSGSSGSSGSGSSGAGSTTAPPTATVSSPAAARAYAAGAVSARGWGGNEYTCLVSLWNKESGWRADAYNASSGAYGIPQSLPGSKMASAGSDWRTNAATQVDWGLGYIAAVYGTPCGAWAHSVSVGWY
ncbi:lytic transglycosylase domain-containing protein [Cryobacterium sp. MDB1-18-1]|uniref:aggregation-promoting factor C-terminal-like domain-containing protein n=2 Tax=unclassified Cryobacterium TaxID=2649013 RepID=UPI00106C093D|nr:lytic transglycosylase domain-containing protein [Cryobacterium sp. MDB1-18-1]TFC45942.1 lytic transglycosylase domain-containing protein [Cryobacterium sp. MDB1-18-1]